MPMLMVPDLLIILYIIMLCHCAPGNTPSFRILLYPHTELCLTTSQKISWISCFCFNCDNEKVEHYLVEIELFQQVIKLVESAAASSTLRKKKVMNQRRIAPWYNSQMYGLDDTIRVGKEVALHQPKRKFAWKDKIIYKNNL